MQLKSCHFPIRPVTQKSQVPSSLSPSNWNLPPKSFEFLDLSCSSVAFQLGPPQRSSTKSSKKPWKSCIHLQRELRPNFARTNEMEYLPVRSSRRYERQFSATTTNVNLFDKVKVRETVGFGFGLVCLVWFDFLWLVGQFDFLSFVLVSFSFFFGFVLFSFGFVLVLFWFWFGFVVVVLWFCFGFVLVLVLVLFWFCCGFVVVLFLFLFCFCFVFVLFLVLFLFLVCFCFVFVFVFV